MEKFEVEDYVGQEEDDVRRTNVNDLYKSVETTKRIDEEVEEGVIIDQFPEAGEMVIPGQEVLILYVSSGPPPFDLADLTGKTLDEAKDYAKENGLTIKEASEREYSEDIEEGSIIRTDPKAGESVRSGDEITVTVSKGVPDPITMKDLVEVEIPEEQKKDDKKEDKDTKDQNKKQERRVDHHYGC